MEQEAYNLSYKIRTPSKFLAWYKILEKSLKPFARKYRLSFLLLKQSNSSKMANIKCRKNAAHNSIVAHPMAFTQQLKI